MGCCSQKYHYCEPKCYKRCIGTYTTKYRVYENCCYSIYKVCNCCGYEYDHRKSPACPRCGAAVMGDPPRFGGFGRGGGGRRFGGFRRFERFPRFGGFFPSFGFFPEFEEEDEEEDIF
jgi:hypothetical protein